MIVEIDKGDECHVFDLYEINQSYDNGLGVNLSKRNLDRFLRIKKEYNRMQKILWRLHEKRKKRLRKRFPNADIELWHYLQQTVRAVHYSSQCTFDFTTTHK
jgi:hypothetical protein